MNHTEFSHDMSHEHRINEEMRVTRQRGSQQSGLIHNHGSDEQEEEIPRTNSGSAGWQTVGVMNANQHTPNEEVNEQSVMHDHDHHHEHHGSGHVNTATTIAANSANNTISTSVSAFAMMAPLTAPPSQIEEEDGPPIPQTPAVLVAPNHQQMFAAQSIEQNSNAQASEVSDDDFGGSGGGGTIAQSSSGQSEYSSHDNKNRSEKTGKRTDTGIGDGYEFRFRGRIRSKVVASAADAKDE
jgi:hypothetical protein